MATKKEAVTKSEELVEVFVPRAGANEDPNLYVSVNSKNYLLPKGKKSMVPKAVAYEIERSRRAEEALDKSIDRLKSMAAASR